MSDFHATPPLIEDEVLREYTASGGDWDDIAAEAERISEERMVINMGPVHPSTHGVLRLILDVEGEHVKGCRVGTGYLHTGIEKNMEYRTWTQGVTFATRMDYVAPIFNEVSYCLAVEKLLGITDQIPRRASEIRVLLMELNRIASHLVAIGSAGNELAATTMMTYGFRGREFILKIFEAVTGLRMNHAYIRPGGVAQDMPAGTVDMVRQYVPAIREEVQNLMGLTMENPIWKARMKKVSYISLTAGMALSLSGPCLRAAGYPMDARKFAPYCGYETYEFDVPVTDYSDPYNRTAVRYYECFESLKIVMQVLDRLDASEGEPVMVEDKRISWPAQLSVGADGQGNSFEHIREIMSDSMESLIHHFKLVTEGFRVPPGQAFSLIEHAKGLMLCHAVSDGGTRPYRVHFREPSFANLQSLSMMVEGGVIADVITALGTIDPVLGGVDR
ncbi:MAG: NADH-quinone oxidoreductase subunit D [bacterium]|nr:NADH-quinone oxidoreductase subunit D [bacterium]